MITAARLPLRSEPAKSQFLLAARHRIAFQQVIEQAGQRRQFTTDGGAGQPALLQLGAPGQNVRPGNCAKFIGAGEPDKTTEVSQVALVRAAGTRVVEIGEPFGGCRHRGQVLEFCSGYPSLITRLYQVGRRRLCHAISLLGGA